MGREEMKGNALKYISFHGLALTSQTKIFNVPLSLAPYQIWVGSYQEIACNVDCRHQEITRRYRLRSSVCLKLPWS